jgi:hypothetical protein
MVKNTFFLYIILSISLIVLSEAIKKLLNLDDLIYFYLSEKMSISQLENYLELQENWKSIGLIILPLLILIKTTLIASVLHMGAFFFSKIKFTFNQLWNIVINAEFIFILVPIFKIVWFYIFQTNYTLEDIQYFFPLSALNIIGYKGLEPWLIYPFQILNLFELAYWLVLAYFIGKATETNMDHGLKIVASSYGSALLLWVVVIMFFTLNYS